MNDMSTPMSKQNPGIEGDVDCDAKCMWAQSKMGSVAQTMMAQWVPKSSFEKRGAMRSSYASCSAMWHVDSSNCTDGHSMGLDWSVIFTLRSSAPASFRWSELLLYIMYSIISASAMSSAASGVQQFSYNRFVLIDETEGSHGQSRSS